MLDFWNGRILEWLDLYEARRLCSGASGVLCWEPVSEVSRRRASGGFRGESRLSGRPPRVRNAGIVWGPSENIPILNRYTYLLRGRCKGCGLPISPRYVLIELATALLFTVTAYSAVLCRLPLSVIPAWCLIVLCIGSACTDCELRIIPDKFTCSGMILALLCAFLFPSTKMPSNMTPLFALTYTFAQIAAVGLFGYSAWYAGKLLFHREALGRGDVKFLMAIAGFTSVFGALVAILTGSLLALLWLLCDAVKRGRLRRKFAYGPFLAAGALLWLLFRGIGMRLLLK